MLQYSAFNSVMSTPQVKGSNAVIFYDLEGYDDAFLKAVDKVEERHCSPANSHSPLFLSPAQCIQRSTSCIRHSRIDADIRKEDLTPKKLDFNAAGNSYRSPSYTVNNDRSMKLKSWHELMLSSSKMPVPPLETLEAHGELSQEKALLVLSHFPKGGWEQAVDVSILKRCKHMDFSEIDGWMRQISSGRKFSKMDWSKQLENHIVFHCEINLEGFWSIKGPYFEQTNSPLQRVFGNGGVLRVRFEDYKKNLEIVEGIYRRIAREGIWVGLRHYNFFAFKDPKEKRKQSGLVEDLSSGPKCFFVCTESLAKWDCFNTSFRQYGTIREAQQYLMHIDTVPTLAKKFVRLQLALSQTLPVFDLDSPDIKVDIIEDIYCRDECGEVVYDANGEELIHTDGTGFISKDLAARCPASVCKGNTKAKHIVNQEQPLLLQVRLFNRGMVAKGTLLVHSKIPPSTIQLRKSMVKVTRNRNFTGPCYNSLEVCSTSRQPGKGRLSPYLALLLAYGGVPEPVLMKFVEKELHEITTKIKSRTAALTALTNSDQDDHYDSAVRMLVANLPLEEPYLQKTLLDLTRSQLQELSTGRVTIPDSYNLMGCADPTGRLERHQVAIILEQGPLLCRKVLVYKSPGLHVGDVKEFEATWHTDFEDIVGNGKYVIFFSVKGRRSVVDEIANSDLDGDQYWCCANEMIVKHFRPSEPWQNPGAVKKSISKTSNGMDDFDKQHFEAFLKARFKPSQAMGIAANSWQAHMDKFLMLDVHHEEREELWYRIQSLVNTYYEAVDASKTGRQISVRDEDRARDWPHYKEKQQEVGSKWIKKETNYHSTSLLGKIYDLVKGECDTKDFLAYLEKLIAQGMFIDKRFEFAGFETYHKKWEGEYKEYRSRMLQLLYDKDAESRNMEIEALFQKYKWELYKAESLIDSPEPIEKIYKQASAIYVVVYNHAQKQLESEDLAQQGFKLKLQFAWKVAGFALLKLFGREWQGKRKEPILIEEAVFRELKFYRKDEK